jgi:hypothetical protein
MTCSTIFALSRSRLLDFGPGNQGSSTRAPAAKDWLWCHTILWQAQPGAVRIVPRSVSCSPDPQEGLVYGLAYLAIGSRWDVEAEK